MLKKLFIATLAGTMLATPLLASAQDDKNPTISYRQKVMSSISANIGAISDVLKYMLPHEKNIQAHAEQMASAAALIPSAFKEEVSEGLTDAKPAVWEEWDEFEEYAGDLESAANKLAEVAASGDTGEIGAQVKKVGDACKQCHEEFRKPEEESYKNQM